MDSGTTRTLEGVWGSANVDVFAVGGPSEGLSTILHYDGADWSPMSSGTTEGLFDVWGSAGTDVYAVGGPSEGLSTILHYGGEGYVIYLPTPLRNSAR
jgi:hypothetical protein